MTTPRKELDKVSLGVIPNPLKLLQALMRPNQPFVMINMLSFKSQATGHCAHLNGEEAYAIYAQSVAEVQSPLGSRIIWSGQFQKKTIADNLPIFDTIGLLEYASPRTFLQANLKGESNIKARSAGLNGQWLIASKTLEEGKPPKSEDDVVLIELSGGMQYRTEDHIRWYEFRQSAYQDVGAKTLWHGRCDHHVLGTATPKIKDALVTWFPNPNALEQALSDAQRNEQLHDIRPYLVYIASSVDDVLPELR